jgi:hypothetical protein
MIKETAQFTTHQANPDAKELYGSAEPLKITGYPASN